MSARRRRRPGPVPVARLLRRFQAPGGAREGVDAAVAAWPGIVGDPAAKVSRPVRRSRSGVLTVACAAAAWSQELAALAEELLARLVAACPDEGFTALRFVVDEQALIRPAPPAEASTRRPVTAEEVAAVAPLVDGVADPRLRDALARAAAAARRRESP